MKLIAGKIHDYYDSLLKYNSAEGNTFQRTNETITLTVYNRYVNYRGTKQTIEDDNVLSALITNNYFGNERKKKVDKIYYQFYSICILFCGKMYFGLRCDKEIPTGLPVKPITTYIYNYDEFLTYCTGEGIEIKQWSKQDNNKWKKPFFRFECLKDYFKPIDFLDFSIDNKLVIAIVDGSKRTYNNQQPVYLNCSLKEYEFYKVFDPYSAYQTLSQYIDGSFAYPGNITIEIADKYKITGKGFDPVYGFRTRPKEKT
jgi:hypothetical protein